MPRLTSRSFFDPHATDRYLPPVLLDLLGHGDPAIAAITARVTDAKAAGRDVTDPEVLEACIAAGRDDHAATSALDGAA